MEDADNDVLMDGDDHHLEIRTLQNGNGFGDHPVFNGSEHSSPDTPSDADNLDDENGSTNYPANLERRGLLPTGCCYDDRMKLHANADFGPSPHHPEDPARIEAIMKMFKKSGLIYTGPHADLLDIMRNTPTKYMWRVPAREATEAEICQVHLARHFQWVQSLSHKSTHELRALTKKMDSGRESLYVGSMTFEASLISAGGAIETCKAVVAGRVKNAIAVIRPPGHHAEYNAPMGFCLFNNVPIAAKVCQKEYPESCRKILILDWDVHHGNGIQNIFYNDPNVLYISIHVYANGEFYPGPPENDAFADGNIDKCGSEQGLGKNVNIGWAGQGMGDGEYMAAFQKIVMPIGQEFDPDLVIISAGFDAAAGDELGQCFVTPTCYAHMTHMLMSLAGGKVAVCLEGGYNLNAISNSALAVARTLMGDPPPRMQMPPLNKDASRLLAKVQAHQAPYWECMRPGIVDATELQAAGGKRLHDVIRSAQRQNLAQKYSMIPLYIQRETLFKSFENQVLVTQEMYKARRIFVIIHDPPEVVAQPDSVDNTVMPHNAWISDGVTKYIDWAVNKNFGILDINVPHYITHPQDADAFTPRVEERVMQDQIKELICYIWDNHLQLCDDADEIFLMGVGYAYLGIKMLLLNRDCKERLTGVVNFVTGNLRPIKSEHDDYLSTWYKDHSRVFVAQDHACWADAALARKVSKRRFGTVIKSTQASLNSMMKEHAGEVEEWILKQVSDQGDTTEEDKLV